MVCKIVSSIRLGLMAPLTGVVSIYGEEISNAARIACAEVNETGGLLGQTFELIIVDDGSLPATAIPAARRLVDEFQCVAIIGNLLSNSRIAIAEQIAEHQRIPYLNFSFYEGSIKGRYFFHFAALPNQQIDLMIPYMVKRFGRKVFFAGSNYEWPRGSIDAAKYALAQCGGIIVGEEYLPIGEIAVEELLGRVARAGTDVFVPYFAGNDQIHLLKKFSELGLKHRIAVVMGHYDEAMAQYLSPEIRAEFYSSNTYFMTVETSRNSEVLKRLETLEGVQGLWPNGNGFMTNFGEGAYTCVHAFANAVRQAGTIDREILVNYLENVEVDAPQGRVIMDPVTHHAQVNSYLACCQADGTFTISEKFGAIAPIIPHRYLIRENSIKAQQQKFQEISHEYNNYHRDIANNHINIIDSINNITTVAHNHAIHRILQLTDIAVIACNEDGIIIHSNNHAAHIFGYSTHELIGLSVHQLLPPAMRESHASHLQNFASVPASVLPMGRRGEIIGYRKDGSQFPAEASLSKFHDGNRWIMVASVRDITENKQQAAQAIWRSTHDQLTGLPNRVSSLEYLNNAIKCTQATNSYMALLLIDLDGLSAVNDTYGHEVGDRLLIATTERMIRTIRGGDILGRLDGKAFIVIREPCDSLDSAGALATRLNDVVRQPLEIQGRKLFITASIGLVISENAEYSPEDMLRDADIAMRRVKETGRDHWRLFSQDLHDKAQRRTMISGGLRTALEQHEFSIRLHPIVDATDATLRGAEVLLRWQSTDGPISPDEFIPLAERDTTIVPIGLWVFEEACRIAANLDKKYGNKAPYLSVNVSTRQLSDKYLAEKFAQRLEYNNLSSSSLILELTETGIMTDVTANIEVLNSLAKLGLKIAVDDFGTGYSSLLQLLRLPISTLKIDKEFINGIEKRGEHYTIVDAVLKMSRALGLNTIAEGVEHETQAEVLRELNCDLLQGFYFSKPLHEKDFLLLAAQPQTQPLAIIEDVYFAIYTSTAQADINRDHMLEILREARAHNARYRITGCLLYLNGGFMQYLEGPEAQVKALMDYIRVDERHYAIRNIITGYDKRRLFRDWNMNFADMSNENPSLAMKQHLAKHRGFTAIAASPWLAYNLFRAMSLGLSDARM